MSRDSRAKALFKPEFRFGMGGVPLGNEFNEVLDRDAEEALAAAWDLGVRYFDVAPWYGFGLSERRFGHFLGVVAQKVVWWGFIWRIRGDSWRE